MYIQRLYIKTFLSYICQKYSDVYIVFMINLKSRKPVKGMLINFQDLTAARIMRLVLQDITICTVT